MLACRYESIDATEKEKQAFFDMRPLAIFFSVRAWYVIGERLEDGDAADGPIADARVRCFKLSRFTKCEPTEKPLADSISLIAGLGMVCIALVWGADRCWPAPGASSGS